MNASVVLIPVDPDGAPRTYREALPDEWAAVADATVSLYKSRGFEEPWICYLALADSVPVGTCGFTAPIRDGRVEIAYFAFPAFEGRGLATAMAAELVSIARRRAPSVIVAARTLPERNASHRILEKLGFVYFEEVDDPKDGIVWEWRLPTRAATANTERLASGEA